MIDARALLAATNGALAIDRELIPGWRLYDAHPHEVRESVRLELVDDADRIVDSEVHRADSGFAVEWRRTSADAEAANAARRAVMDLLRNVPAEIGASSTEAESHAPVFVRDAASEDDPLLAQDFRAYALLYGCSPRRVRVATTEFEALGDSAFYPDPVRGTRSNAAALYPFPRRFRTRRRFREYLVKLGFALDAEGRGSTVPLPETFRKGVFALTGRLPVWMPRLQTMNVLRGGIRGWAVSVADGWLPAMVPPIALIRVLRLLPESVSIPPPFAPGILAHDVSLHGFAMHRVRPEELSQVFDGQLPFARRWRQYRLSLWFESTLTREAWDVWNQVERPEAFDEMFAKKIPSLARSFVEEVLGNR